MRNKQLFGSRVLPFFFLSAFAGSVCAQAGDVDSLQDVVTEALEYQPEVQAKFHEFMATIHDRREAFGGYLPRFDLEGSLGKAERNYDDRGWYNRNYGEARLTQMLFDGFYVRSRVARAEHTKRQRYFDLLDEIENKTLEAINVYIDVQRYRDMVRLAQVNYDNHKRVQQHISERADRGVSNQADLFQINGRLSLAESNLLTEAANLHTVEARFQRLIGRPPAKKLEPISEYQFQAARDLQDALITAYSRNPSLHASFENIQAAEASLGEAKSARYPKLDFIARHGTYRNNNGFTTQGDPHRSGRESIVELRATFNLYRGGSDRAAERAARTRIRQAEDLRNKACVDIRQTTTIAHADISNLQIKQNSLFKHRDNSRRVVVAYREQFDIGRRSLLDVLDSENEAFQAERAYVHGKYDLVMAHARTLHVMGELLESMGALKDDLSLFDDDSHTEYGPYTSSYCSTLDSAVMDIKDYLDESTVADVLDLSSDVLFAVDSYAIRPGARQSLNTFIEYLKDLGGEVRLINIVGHTDSTGNQQHNQTLSINRAKAVRNALVEAGVDGQRIRITGLAATQPIALNTTDEGRAKNRRVTLTVVRNR